MSPFLYPWEPELLPFLSFLILFLKEHRLVIPSHCLIQDHNLHTLKGPHLGHFTSIRAQLGPHSNFPSTLRLKGFGELTFV